MLSQLDRFVFGPPAQSALPERVRRSIDAQGIQTEKLIGWIQLALVVFFIVLYALAPKTSTGTPFLPVPIVLGAYLIFTIIRLVIAHRSRLPGWFLYLSVVGDIGILMVLIWSFHVQYDQPAPFYLKAPTLLYVFIFISLRTLRFEPSYVIAAGVTAAVGWLALLWYALDAMVGEMGVVTRDYVQYLTSNTVLVGAEIDKIISIMLVTFVLAVAQVRARRLLIRAVADATAARDLSRLVSPEIAEQITRADRELQPGDGEVKTATVLFTDIAGFSSIAERVPPDQLMQMLNEYVSIISDVIDRHNGVITEFRGDAMLITFNAATPDPDHAANALRTAIGIQQVVGGMRFGPDVPLPTRCGINTGELIAGALGTRDRLLFTVHGDEVNIAARLEQLNKSYGTAILATEQTVRAAGPDFAAARRIDTVTVRGRSGPVMLYTVDPPQLPFDVPDQPAQKVTLGR